MMQKIRLAANSSERSAMMRLPPDEQEQIRRAFHLEGKPIRQIAREMGHSRPAIRNALSLAPPLPKPYDPSTPHSAPVFGPFQARVDELLAQNDELPRKQRYTAHRIFEIIKSEGYQGCESRVRQHISAW